MFRFRRININEDRDFLLEFHCRINFESETPYARKLPYEEYRKKWLSTSQPESFLSDLAKTMEENRTIAEILEIDCVKVGYLRVTFTDVQDYGITIAGIMDIAVARDYQRRGIGIAMLRHVEELVKAQGATLLRSDTGIENLASQKLHESFGFDHTESIMKKSFGNVCWSEVSSRARYASGIGSLDCHRRGQRY